MESFKIIDGGKAKTVSSGQKTKTATCTISTQESSAGDNILPPQEFRHAIATLKDAIIRPELFFEEIPSTSRLAPFSIAIRGEVPGSASSVHTVYDGDEDLATGRFILLYNPEFMGTWKGNFRIVTYIRAQLEPDISHDVLAGSLVWDWFREALLKHQTRFTNAGGTATRVLSEGFGALKDEECSNNIELRASWTPLSSYMQEHLQAWAEMMSSFAGLPPTQEIATPISRLKLNYETT